MDDLVRYRLDSAKDRKIVNIWEIMLNRGTEYGNIKGNGYKKKCKRVY